LSHKNNNLPNQQPSQPKAAEAKKRSKFVTIFVFAFVFTIAWLPIVLSVTGVGGVDTLPFSIYNTTDPPGDGCSELADTLTSDGYEVRPLISSLSVVNGIPDNSVLVVIGPTHFFSIIDSSALLDFFSKGGSMLIVDDFGSANNILDGLAQISPDYPSQMVGFTKVSRIRFNRGLLLDADNNEDGKPLLPVINTINDGGRIFSGSHHVIMNYATGLSGIQLNESLASSSTNSWIVAEDVVRLIQQVGNQSLFAYNQTRGDQVGPFPLLAELQAGNGRIILLSDPSIFINNMIDRGTNRAFALELFQYLAQQANARTIIFDHNHLGWLPTAPVLYVGLLLGQITYVSTNWLLAPLAPLLAIWMVRKYIPFGKPEKQKPLEMYRLRGQTLFTRTLYDYINKQRYDDALQVIYGQLKRDLRRKHGLRVFDVPRLLVSISRTRRPDDIAQLTTDFEAIEKAIHESRRINREQFLDLFFKIERIRENIG
jgi:hypothetical protein